MRWSGWWILGFGLVGLAACETEGGEWEGGELGEGGGTTGGGGGGGGGGGTCSTGRTVHVEEGATMQPGGDCIGCHSRGEGPRFTVAGTVMNDYTDAVSCEGIDGVRVRITDAGGQEHVLVTNSAGNFFTSEAMPTPLSVTLEYAGDTRSMGSAAPSGDCASCHTAQGASGAPGRVLAP